MSGRLLNDHRLNDSLPSKMTQAASASSGGQSAHAQLKRFGRAKAKINSIYEEIIAYGSDVAKFLHFGTSRRGCAFHKDSTGVTLRKIVLCLRTNFWSKSKKSTKIVETKSTISYKN